MALIWQNAGSPNSFWGRMATHCHRLRTSNRTVLLTEILSVCYRNEKNSSKAEETGPQPLLPHLKLSIAVTVTGSIRLLCSTATAKLTSNMYLTLYTGKVSRLPWHPSSSQDQSNPHWNTRCAAEVQCPVACDVTAMLIIGIYFWRCATL